LARAETTLEDERETTRVQFELPPASMERLRKLKELTEAGSYAEVFRNALRYYEFLIQQAEAGNEVVVQDRSDPEKRTVIVRP
jgi:hypothetical protein